MKIRNLYLEYFEQKNISKGYQSEQEYWKDLFHLVDILLSIACLLRAEITKSEDGAVRLDNMHLRGVAVTMDEILRELTRDHSEETVPWKIPKDDVNGIIGEARFHIRSRLQFSSRKTEFRLPVLIQMLQLSEFEQFLVILSMMVYDKKYEPVFSYLQGDVRLREPTIGLAVSLCELCKTSDCASIGAVREKSGLLFQYMLELYPVPDLGAAIQVLRLSKRIYSYLLGYDGLSSDLEAYVEFFSRKEILPAIGIREDQLGKLKKYIRFQLQENTEKGNILNLYGNRGIGKRYLLKQAARELGLNVLFVEVYKLLNNRLADIQELMRKIAIETMVTGSLTCFCYTQDLFWNRQGESGESETRPPGLELILGDIRTSYKSAFWITHQKADYLLEYRIHVKQMELPMLSVHEKIRLWNQLTPGYSLDDSVDLNLCANQYILTPGEIAEVLKTAELLRIEEGTEKITKEYIRQAVTQQSANQLGRCATQIRSIYTWDDLVVSPEQRRQMDMVCNQIKFKSIVGEEWGFHKKTAYGRGVCALFYGSPGTGKTMAVQVIANELGLDLYRVDLSQIVSKYIGETEKNISDLFARAKNINALLFFDEADALFAKRSEVKDSHDRNANSETAHLLQKLEDYEGIAILATNYINNIDDAFKRRIKFMINFSFPTAQVRLQLWNTIIPREVPLEEELDFEFFAEKFELSGSNIKEVLTNAAYIAAAAGTSLANRHVVESVKLNFAKYGKILTKEDFEYLGEA